MIRNINEIAVDSFDNIRYLLSSALRLKVLRVLLESDASFDTIKKYLKKDDTNIHRTLKELQDIKLVECRDKTYSLTSTGYLATRNIMNLLDNWKTITRYARCINYHSFKKLPLEFVRYMYILDESDRIESTYSEYYKTRNIYGQKIKDAHNLKIILPIYSKEYIEFYMKVIKTNSGTLELITSRNIYNTIRQSEFHEEFKKYKHEGKIRLWITEEDVHEIFLSITDTFSSISFFYKDDTYDDTTFFWDAEFESKKTVEILFETYKHKMSSKEVK